MTTETDDDDDDEGWLREIAATSIGVPHAEDLAGTTIARYRLERVLGRGGMGVVYLARDEKLDRVVALKLLLTRAVRNDERRKRFLREARIAAKIVDPHIATVFDAGEDGERVYLAMEYVEGQSLRAELRERGKLAVEDALRITAQIARALGRAHDEGIIHRDVKPDNVILAKDGGVKVLDFGVAKLHDHARSSAVESTLATRVGTTVGTPAYMSPEQAKGGKVDARSDLFSLGVLLYELLAGHRPFEGKTPLDVLVAIDRDDPTPLTRVRSDVPRWIDALVRRCLAKDPAERPQSAREVLETIEAGPRSQRPPRRTVLLAGALGVGALATTLALGWSMKAPREQRTDSPIPVASAVEPSAPPSTTASVSESPPAEGPPAEPPAASAVVEKAAVRPAMKPKSAPSSSTARPPTKPGPLDDPK